MKRRRAGFSLLESLMAMTILTLMVGAILSLYSKGQSDAIEQGRYPLAWITRDVKLSTAIEPSWNGYTASSNTLILRIPSVDANGLIIDMAAHSDHVIYRIEGRRLYRIVDAEDGVSARVDRTRVLADGMAALAFAYYDASGTVLTSQFDKAASVQPTLTSRQQGDQRSFRESLDTNVKLRNK
jgi:prepilin-type N-terminal cleavage/methylation domain-containing protein